MTRDLKREHTSHTIPIYPPLVACFPLLALYSANTGLIPLAQVWLPLAYAASGSCVLWLIAGLATRDIHCGAALATLVTVSFLGYGRASEAAHGWCPEWLIAAVWFAVTFGLAVAIFRRASRIRRSTAILNFASAAAVAVSGTAIYGALLQGESTGRLAMSDVPASGKASVQPDVFYIILDCYGRPDQLRRVMRFDDEPFVEALRQRDFYVADASHTNYVQTEMSVASSLNLDYLDRLLPKMAPDSKDRTVLDHLVDDSLVAATLRKAGYRYVAVTSGFPSFTFPSADQVFDRKAGYSFFEQAVINETPLARGGSVSVTMFDQRREQLIQAFAALRQLAIHTSRPKFVFAHILAPHPPFVFGPNGEPRQPKNMLFKIADGSHFMKNGGTPEEYRTGYIEQAEWLNKQVLGLVDALLDQRGTRPIVLIQGDHGSKMRIDMDSSDHSDLNECMSNLSAFLVPDGVRRRLTPSVTPVNSFRMIFDDLLGEKMDLLPDRNYFSPWSRPYAIEDVTSKLALSSATVGPVASRRVRTPKR